MDRRPIVVNNGGRRQRFVNGGGGGPVVNIIDAVGRVANSPTICCKRSQVVIGSSFRVVVATCTMTKLAVISLFRDNIGDVRRTFVERARWGLDQKKVLHICIEGDSRDGTHEELKKVNGFRTIVEKIDQGTEKIGSFAEKGRLQALAQLWNRGLDIAVCEKAHYTLMLDSDITVPPDVLPKLITHGKDVISPMFFFEKSVFFRDTWAYHQGDIDFINRYPYHRAYKNNKLFEVDGVGVPLMKYEVLLRGARCDDNEVRGLSQKIKELGYKIWMDPAVAVYHPRLGQEIPKTHEK